MSITRQNLSVIIVSYKSENVIENCINYQNTVPVWFVFTFFLYTPLKSCIDCIAKWKKKKDNLPAFNPNKHNIGKELFNNPTRVQIRSLE